MDLLEAIKSRRAVRNFTSRNVSNGLLNLILEAGRFAPSPLNSQPWHFIVIRNKKVKENLSSQSKHGGFLPNANVIIVITIDKAAKVDEWLARHHQHILSGACAMENMWLAASSLGLGCSWVSIDDATSRDVLSIPDSVYIVGSLAIGYPKSTLQNVKEPDRKPLSESIFYEKFGNKND